LKLGPNIQKENTTIVESSEQNTAPISNAQSTEDSQANNVADLDDGKKVEDNADLLGFNSGCSDALDNSSIDIEALNDLIEVENDPESDSQPVVPQQETPKEVAPIQSQIKSSPFKLKLKFKGPKNE
jgi:hypothetical protein